MSRNQLRRGTNRRSATQFEPLYDPHGDHYTGWEKFLVGMPFISPSRHLRPSWKEQSAKRGEEVMRTWEGADVPRDFALEMSRIVAEHMEWPQPYLLPQDGCRFVFFDGDDDVRKLYCERALEKRYRVKVREIVSDMVPVTFGELVARFWKASGQAQTGAIVSIDS